MANTGQIYDKFLDEYGSEDAVRKYTTETAGYGISYLLHHDYANIYIDAVNTYLRTSQTRPLRLLEFGCGGGMNITRLVALMEDKGHPFERAYGTDFSSRLVQAAAAEAKAYLPPRLAEKLSFHVGRNEELINDLSSGTGVPVDQLAGSLDLVLGVNTFRYCHRLKKEQECAADIFRLLRPGGVCVNIDMNDRFPAFRSRLRGCEKATIECYVPTLEEYAKPFKAIGFELVRQENFCWIPHSAGRGLTITCRLLTPFLNLVMRSRAMRCLVVARKPA